MTSLTLLLLLMGIPRAVGILSRGEMETFFGRGLAVSYGLGSAISAAWFAFYSGLMW